MKFYKCTCSKIIGESDYRKMLKHRDYCSCGAHASWYHEMSKEAAVVYGLEKDKYKDLNPFRQP